jgi:hypothetical protein
MKDTAKQEQKVSATHSSHSPSLASRGPFPRRLRTAFALTCFYTAQFHLFRRRVRPLKPSRSSHRLPLFLRHSTCPARQLCNHARDPHAALLHCTAPCGQDANLGPRRRCLCSSSPDSTRHLGHTHRHYTLQITVEAAAEKRYCHR